jgi:hypothetical protein
MSWRSKVYHYVENGDPLVEATDSFSFTSEYMMYLNFQSAQLKVAQRRHGQNLFEVGITYNGGEVEFVGDVLVQFSKLRVLSYHGETVIAFCIWTPEDCALAVLVNTRAMRTEWPKLDKSYGEAGVVRDLLAVNLIPGRFEELIKNV